MKDRRNDFGTIYATDTGRGYSGYPGTKGHICMSYMVKSRGVGEACIWNAAGMEWPMHILFM